LTSTSLNKIGFPQFEQIDVKFPEKFISAIRHMDPFQRPLAENFQGLF